MTCSRTVLVFFSLLGTISYVNSFDGIFGCSNNTMCASVNYPDVGICTENGTCDCILETDPNLVLSQCFTTNNETSPCSKVAGYCYVKEGSERGCVKSLERLTALLLSIFLINFGAANFYIMRYDLAIAQLIIGLIACVFQVGSCAERCVSDEDSKATKMCVFCCGFNTLFSCLLFIWWLADLIMFATNMRLDGRGCPLTV